MELREYLFRNNIERKHFAEKVGCSVQTITHALHKKSVSFAMAQKISMATGLEVGIYDLLPHAYLFCIAEYRRTKKPRHIE